MPPFGSAEFRSLLLRTESYGRGQTERRSAGVRKTGRCDLTKKLSPSELKATTYAVYYTANKAGDREGKQLADLMVSGKRRWLFPVEYDYYVSAVDSMIHIMQQMKKSKGLTPDLRNPVTGDAGGAYGERRLSQGSGGLLELLGCPVRKTVYAGQGTGGLCSSSSAL